MIAALALRVALLLPCLAPPVPGPVARQFRAPACTYCAGHRGIEYSTFPGTPVRAVAAGEVTFAGRVAGTIYVVVRQDDGLTATYGFLRTVQVRRAQRVAAGDVVGAATERVYFGWKQGEQPVDPSARLGTWWAPPRLVPTDGSRSRPSLAGRRLLCPASGASVSRPNGPTAG